MLTLSSNHTVAIPFQLPIISKWITLSVFPLYKLNLFPGVLWILSVFEARFINLNRCWSKICVSPLYEFNSFSWHFINWERHWSKQIHEYFSIIWIQFVFRCFNTSDHFVFWATIEANGSIRVSPLCEFNYFNIRIYHSCLHYWSL